MSSQLMQKVTIEHSAAGSEIARNSRVAVNTSGVIELAAADSKGEGTLIDKTESGATSSGLMVSGPGVREFICAGTVAKNALAYTAANGRVDDDATGTVLLGRFLTAGSAGSIVEVLCF